VPVIVGGLWVDDETVSNPCKVLKFKVLQNKPDIDTRKNNSLREKANVPKGRGAKLPV
jgi:hypothetical protein